jgi:hypothetical protein
LSSILNAKRPRHRFEGWFGSSEDYAEQHARRLVTCPVCGSSGVTKAVMAPHVGHKGNQLPDQMPKAVPARAAAEASPATAPAPAPPLSPQAAAVLQAIAKAQAEALKSSTWVGKQFVEQARAMHYGEQDNAMIHGEASPDEAEGSDRGRG